MEFYVVNEKQVCFRTSNLVSDVHVKKCVLLGQQLTLDYVTDCERGEGAFEEVKDGLSSGGNSFRKYLMDFLCKGTLVGQTQPLSKSVYLGVFVVMKSSHSAYVKILTSKLDRMDVGDAKRDVQIFERLHNSALPPNSFGFNFKLNLFLGGKTDQLEIFDKDLRVTLLEKSKMWNYELTTTDIKISDEFWCQWNKTDREFLGKMTLTLCLDPGAIAKLYLEKFEKDHFREWPRKMLTEGCCSDMIILAGGEKDKDKGIKCHKFILSDRSPVFKAMFETTGMSECRDNVLEMVDMTEAGVRALLQFIYCWDLEEAAEKCEMALELLEAGHKYQMEDLVEAVAEIFCGMHCKWFSVDVALKLLLFSRNVGEKLGKLEKKSLQVLKWYTQRPGSLMASVEYQKLYLESPRIAMELGELFLEI